MYTVKDNDDIGHGFSSMTDSLKCVEYSQDSTYIIDTPGFADTRNIEIDIATSVAIRNVALKAKRLRFVLLINSYSIHADRANGLKKNQEYVTKFIGDSFAQHEKAFTFIFTHCQNTLDALKERDYTSGSYSESEKVRVISEARKQLRLF